jgi:KaiC/GvpD/RAD55 family RecA-like ATPase
LMVTTRESAIHILESFKENKLDLPLSRLRFVDCVSKILGSTAVETDNIKIANSPMDLTGIGVKISQFFEEFFMNKNIQKIQLHINSLSTLLMYSNIQTIFRFLYVITGRIKAAGALGIYVIDSGMHDEQTIATLKQLCDGVIEIKSENDRNFIRMVGLFPKSSPWFNYEIDRANVKIAGKNMTDRLEKSSFSSPSIISYLNK